MPHSERQYPHPLAVQAAAAGLRVHYPGPSITANKSAIFGFMPADAGEDLLLGHSGQTSFPDARVDSFSDWFVTARFGPPAQGMSVSYGHGSPFVYALYDGGSPRLTLARAPEVWSGSAADPVLGISVNGRHYGLFGPTGAKWSGLDGKVLTCQTGGKRYFSLAVLPDRLPQTLALFRKHAYAHVTDTMVTWKYDAPSSSVITRFQATTRPYEGTEKGTLLALYPHQWSRTAQPLLPSGYASVRGPMKLVEGASFATTMRFPGVLPALPDRGGYDRAMLKRLLREDAAGDDKAVRDTYADGKQLGRLAALLPIAEQLEEKEVRASLLKRLKERLEDWFTAEGSPERLFYYNKNWGALIGYPASFGSDVELNDHHFHYGYFLKAAAEIAQRDRAWAADERWGGMVRLLIRNIVSADRADPLFPFLRNFDPYAGHSWASGHARFGDGNNNESSSEAMNAWTALILWGEATGDLKTRDLGVYLYTTEMEAINAYWFDVEDRYHHPDYSPSVVTMVWGGKGANGTWFSANPEAVHGINWLPIHGGSLYLGHYPEYVRRNYEALVRENGGTQWDEWSDIIRMYRALSDPDDALQQLRAAGDRAPVEAGNSRTNLHHWIYNLSALGQVDRTTTANHPLYAVFTKGGRKSYVVYHTGDRPKAVAFSDKTRLTAAPNGFTVHAPGMP